MDEQYLKIPEVAERLRVSRATVYNFIKAGKLQTVKFGGSRRVALSALLRFEASGNTKTEEAGSENPA